MIIHQIKEKIFTQVNLIRFTCFFWILGKVFTYESWLGGRALPTVSFIEALDGLPPQLHLLLYVLSLALLTTILIKPLRWLIVAFMFVEVFSVLLDALRLQAWEYMYLFLFGYFALYFYRSFNFRQVAVCILSSTYFFSGLHKFNGAFLHKVWDLFFLKHIFSYNSPITPFIHYAGISMSIIEAAAGFLLFFSKNKKNAMYILIPMHLFILFFKMVLEHQPFNSIVPWNVMTIIYLLYILSTSADVQIEKEKAVLPVSTKIVLSIFWFVLPLCSFVRLWPLELSSGMYTGKNDGVNICVKDDEKMRPFRKAYILNSKSTICEGGKVFSLAWYTHLQYSQGPINLVWYYKQLYYRLRKQYPDNDIRMFYKTYTDKKIIQVE